MVRKLVILLILFSSTKIWAESLSESLGLSEEDISREIQNLRQRKTDFKKDREFLLNEEHLSAQERSDIAALKKERALERQEAESARHQYVREQARIHEPDAVEREKIENAFQDEEDRKEKQLTNAFLKLSAHKARRISAAHVSIDENLEYDIRVPVKANRAKSNGTKTKSWIAPE